MEKKTGNTAHNYSRPGINEYKLNCPLYHLYGGGQQDEFRDPHNDIKKYVRPKSKKNKNRS